MSEERRQMEEKREQEMKWGNGKEVEWKWMLEGKQQKEQEGREE